MRLMTGRSRSLIGIDVGARQVKLAQLGGGPGRWRLEEAATFPRMESGPVIQAAEIERIGDVLVRRGFIGRKVAVATPANRLLSGVLELPAAAGGVPVEQLARMEMARTHRVDPESFALSYWDLPASVRPGEGSRVFAAACCHEDADAYLDMFESQGLDVCALDVTSCATVRACAPLINESQAVTAILDVGWTSVRLVLMYQGWVVFERVLEESGVEPVHRMLAHRFSLEAQAVDQLLRRYADPHVEDHRFDTVVQDMQGMLASQYEAIVQEVRVSLTYVTHQFGSTPAKRLLLVGGGAMLPGIADVLTQGLEVEAVCASTKRLVQCDGDEHDSAMYATAIGLAQWRDA